MTAAVFITIQALLAQSSVTAITSTRIQPHPLKQGTALPAIAIAMSAENENLMLAGQDQYPETSVQVHCIATTATDAIKLGEAVKTSLRDLAFTHGGARGSFTKDAVDFTDYSDDLTTHRRVMSFNVRWR